MKICAKIDDLFKEKKAMTFKRDFSVLDLLVPVMIVIRVCKEDISGFIGVTLKSVGFPPLRKPITISLEEWTIYFGTTMEMSAFD